MTIVLFTVIISCRHTFENVVCKQNMLTEHSKINILCTFILSGQGTVVCLSFLPNKLQCCAVRTKICLLAFTVKVLFVTNYMSKNQSSSNHAQWPYEVHAKSLKVMIVVSIIRYFSWCIYCHSSSFHDALCSVHPYTDNICMK